jgi:hypothetical protein
MIETFLITGLAGGIVALIFYTLGAEKTVWVFVGVCVLGLLIGIFEDKDFGSSNAERQANTDKLMAEYQKSKTGCVQGDCVNGEGIYVFEDGDRYEGFFKNSKFHGQGLMLWNNGGGSGYSGYKGKFLEGYIDGYGLYAFANGDTYEGVFEKGKFHGQGIYKYKSGGSYAGGWVNGVKDGPGVYTFDDGSRRSALWENGEDYCATNYMIKVFKCPNP